MEVVEKQTKAKKAPAIEVHADQTALFAQDVEWSYLEQVLGSGYEEDVSRLAIADVIAKRAARKNMQIHSAMILKINGEFSGFFCPTWWWQQETTCEEAPRHEYSVDWERFYRA